MNIVGIGKTSEGERLMAFYFVNLVNKFVCGNSFNNNWPFKISTYTKKKKKNSLDQEINVTIR